MLSRRDFALSGLLAPLAARAQQVSIQPRPRPAPARDAETIPNLRVDANLVLVPVSVRDHYNRPITGLEKDNFRVFDDKVEQSITHFSMEDQPAAIGLIFDVSGSMSAKLKQARRAAAAFFRYANPDDDYFLIQFASAPKLLVPLTRDTAELQSRLAFTKSKGSTALVDALILGLHEVKKSKNPRKALLIISDGGENNSRYSDSELINMVRETDVLIYGIGVFAGGTTREEYDGPYLLAKLSEESGGHALPAGADLADTFVKIGIELRNRYVLGYSRPNQQRDGKQHSIQVTVVPPRGMGRLYASWRRAYQAPLD